MDLEFLIANRMGYAQLLEDAAKELTNELDAGLLRGLADRLRKGGDRQPDVLHRHLAEGLRYASGFLDGMATRIDNYMDDVESAELTEMADDCREAAKLMRDALLKFGLWSSVTSTGQGGGGGKEKPA